MLKLIERLKGMLLRSRVGYFLRATRLHNRLSHSGYVVHAISMFGDELVIYVKETTQDMNRTELKGLNISNMAGTFNGKLFTTNSDSFGF